MKLYDTVIYVGSDPQKGHYSYGMVIDLRPTMRPGKVTVNWANMTPTYERVEDLRVLGYQETTGQYIARNQGTGFMPPFDSIWLVGH